MGLPQEVIDRIVNMLQDNRRTLKACSLTCKAMFASTRHLIHQTLRVTEKTNQKILTPAEKKRYPEWNARELQLRHLSYMGECHLLKYARHLDICMVAGFSQYTLEPHLQHFWSLDRIHTLTIRNTLMIRCHHGCPRDDIRPLFTHFYPTLTTLVFNSPIDHHRHVLQFVVQFPNLENLTLESLRDEPWTSSVTAVPPIVGQSPPLRGHLRCAGLSPRNPVWPREFAFDLPNGINFRSIEFQDVHWEQGQQILNGCASSLEEFTVHITEDGANASLPPFVQPELSAVVSIFRRLRIWPAQIPG
jgi:hypothetical protein